MSRNAISIAKRNVNGGPNALENARATDIDTKNSQQVTSRTRSQTFPADAFDNVWWPLVLKTLWDRRCPRNVFEGIVSSFSDRRVVLVLGSSSFSKRATRGCPQVSDLGPTCWNIIFDDLLRSLDSSIGNNFVAYTDGLLVFVERSRGSRPAKLQIPVCKAEAIVLKSGMIHRATIGRRGGARPDKKRNAVRAVKAGLASIPTIRLVERAIKFKREVRYLGVHVGEQMSVSAHCSHIENKICKLFGKIAGLAGNRWGFRYGTPNTIYSGFFTPIAEYAASALADICTKPGTPKFRAI